MVYIVFCLLDIFHHKKKQQNYHLSFPPCHSVLSSDVSFSRVTKILQISLEIDCLKISKATEAPSTLFASPR